MSQPESQAKPTNDANGYVMLPTNRAVSYAQVVTAIRQLQTRVFNMSSSGTNAQKIAELRADLEALEAQVTAAGTASDEALDALRTQVNTISEDVGTLEGSVTDRLAGKASAGHNHDGTYAPASHTHPYSPSSHNHDSAYAPSSHTHPYSPTSHNHDSSYAPSSHTHPYAPTSHNHDSAYAAAGHNHDAAYAAKSHGHTLAMSGGQADVVSVILGNGGTGVVQVTIAPAMPNTSYAAPAVLASGVAALSVDAVTIVSGSRVDVTLKNNGAIGIAAGRVTVTAARIVPA